MEVHERLRILRDSIDEGRLNRLVEAIGQDRVAQDLGEHAADKATEAVKSVLSLSETVEQKSHASIIFALHMVAICDACCQALALKEERPVDDVQSRMESVFLLMTLVVSDLNAKLERESDADDTNADAAEQ